MGEIPFKVHFCKLQSIQSLVQIGDLSVFAICKSLPNLNFIQIDSLFIQIYPEHRSAVWILVGTPLFLACAFGFGKNTASNFPSTEAIVPCSSFPP